MTKEHNQAKVFMQRMLDFVKNNVYLHQIEQSSKGNMVKKGYMRVVFTLLLLLYFVAGVEQSVAMLLCECQSHHSNEFCCHDEHCEHSSKMVFKPECECEHEHTVDIALYTDGRSVDVSATRAYMLCIPLCVDNIRLDILEGLDIDFEYQPYLLPPLEDAASAASVLRAPPVLA